MSENALLIPILEALTAEINAVVADLYDNAPAVSIDRSKPEFSSDFQSAAAMQLVKVLRRNPRQIAQQIVDGLAGSELFEAPDISGPGFIGFRLSDATLQRYLAGMLASDRLGVPETGQGTVVIDYSSPNVAKRMHVAHIRSTIIGDALRRLGAFVGHEVIGDNHIGDWGTQFGQLIWAWKNWRDDAAFAADPVPELERIYVKFNRQVEEDPSFQDLAREELVKLQAGDEENLAIWRLMIDSSKHAFDTVYDRLDVRFDVTNGESFYNDQLQGIVEDMLAAGHAEISEGAAVVFFRDEDGEDVMPPFLVRKSDGAALYATTDIATVMYRQATWDPARIIYVTDTRQQNHFRQLFEVARRMGVTTRLDHVWFGMMSLPDGAFSTRKGNAPSLHDLLDEAERRARAQQVERLEKTGEEWSDEELDEFGRVIGLGGVKYADLHNNSQSNITFSFDKMLSLEGNTAVYLQYTSARTNSLIRKAAGLGKVADGTTLKLVEPQERDLLLHAMDFDRAVNAAWDLGKPNLLATHLYELASHYHSFWQACPVLKSEDEDVVMSRLNLNLLTQKTLVLGLSLLGIEVPARM